MTAWVAYMTASGLLAAVFALSVRHKIRDFPRFRASLLGYALLPVPALGMAAVMIVVLELAAIALLLVPVGPGRWLAFGLLSLYTGAIAFNLARGRTEIDCGCGDQPTRISAWLLLRNGLLLALTLTPAPQVGMPGAGGWLLVAVLVGLLCLFYLTVEQLLANNDRSVASVG